MKYYLTITKDKTISLLCNQRKISMRHAICFYEMYSQEDRKNKTAEFIYFNYLLYSVRKHNTFEIAIKSGSLIIDYNLQIDESLCVRMEQILENIYKQQQIKKSTATKKQTVNYLEIVNEKCFSL